MLEFNKIYLGDCLKLLKQIDDHSIDLVLTDPPYFFEPEGKGLATERKQLFNGLKDIGVNKNHITEFLLNELLRVCRTPNIFIFCNKSQLLTILSFCYSKHLSFEIIPFCKTAPIPFSNNQWLPDREWGVHLFKNLEVYGNYSTKKGFFIDNNYKQDRYNHPSIKPEYIIRRIMLNLSKEGQLILDCFMGGGTTGVVAKQINRNFIGIEINQKFIDIADKRLSQNNLQIFLK